MHLVKKPKCGLSWADEVQLLLTRYDSNIKTVADLKGKRFGIPLNQDAIIDFSRAQAIRGLENSLKTVNLKVNDLELVDCLRADILAPNNNSLKKMILAFMVTATKLMQVQRSWH